MLDALLSGGLGAALGGVTGLIGNWLNNKKEIKLAELRLQEKAADRQHERDMQANQYKGELALRKEQNSKDMAISADNLMASSYKLAEGDIDKTENHNGFVRFIFGVVEFCRRLVRPTASFGSMAVLGYITLFVYDHLPDFLDNLMIMGSEDEAFLLMKYLVGTICYISTTVVLWWFGTRTKRPDIGK